MDVIKLEKYNFDISKIKNECDEIINKVGLHEHHNQISLKHTGNDKFGNNWYQGCGSLKYVFGEGGGLDSDGNPIEHEVKLTQSDFTVLNSELDYLAHVHNVLSEDYDIGRFRIMAMKHKKVMSMHTDTSKRIHIPIITNENCLMVIDRVIYHMDADGSVYLTDTTKPHTAFNANHKFLRLHLLFDLI